jgi:recombination protein RecT
MEPQFKAALPPQITPEKFLRVAQTAITSNPQLLTADRTSLYSAVMKAAQDGLLCDGRESAIVMFKDKATYMPMVGGILKKVRNSGDLSSITAQVVFEKDTFSYWIDSDGEHLDHKPLIFGERGKEVGVYALAKTKDGAVYIEVLTANQVDDIKKVSRSKDSGPWAGPFKHEMWKKSAIRRLSKRLPMSTDLEMVIKADDEVFMPPEQDESPAETEPRPAKKSRLKAAIEAEREVTTSEPPVDIGPQDVPI